MKYRLAVFGVKDTSENIVEFIHKNIRPVDLVITISREVLNRNQVLFLKRTAIFLPMKKRESLWEKMSLRLPFPWDGKG